MLKHDQLIEEIVIVDHNRNDKSEVYSSKIKAGKRTYFFDVKSTRGNDYYITITESKRRFDGDGYDKHKIFLYKEDFNKFMKSLMDTVNYVKTELMPDFNYDEYEKPRNGEGEEGEYQSYEENHNSTSHNEDRW